MSLSKNKAPLIILYKRTNLKEQRKSFKKYYNALSEKKKRIFRYILDSNRHQKHRLHVVSPSPWPIYSAACAFLFVIGMVSWMHGYTSIPLICGVISLTSAFVFWFRDIIREGVYMGYHTRIVNSCLRLGFVLFLVSEVMFFFGFFWALFHYSLTPSIFGGGIWPPQGIVLYLMSENVNSPTRNFLSYLKVQSPVMISEYHDVDNLIYDSSDFDVLLEQNDSDRRRFRKKPKNWGTANTLPNRSVYYFFKRKIYGNPGTLFWNNSKIYLNFYSHGVLINPYKIPLLNTAILLTSGFILTVSHSYLREELYRACYRTLLLTIYFGLYFIFLQAREYVYSGFSMNDGVYGSIFYMLTGFHGFHVIVGTIFLIVCAFRLRLSHFTSNNHFAFEAAAWYWHFVDVVWILLYLLLYLWPNARYFTNVSTMSFDPERASIVINMTAEFYFKYLNKDPNFRFSTDINFEYSLKKKAKIIKDILRFWEKEIIKYEDQNEFKLNRIRRAQWRRLLAKMKHF